ncbi:aspartic proteinase-like protein 2-like [Tripterygium wilfordii]|uniref:Aspartic proteinase-like protein 2-like n=1 Tax=Tripterygium wilfordii TaxID=458696 RepID=A0A7J7DWC3_TRIWF|nr:aspartic proteinase 39 isoform X1 [Tripterygium wilfordii]KAF5750454.1 aspartic proteinase-like protein 2-like [Tripterygium wilfordii]
MRFLHTFLLLVVGFATVTVVYCASFLPLERTFPLNRPVEIDRLKTRDLVRHARLLQRVSVGGIVDFPVEGSSDPFQAGLYFTKVKLGSPPREFNVQIDTGSDVLWVNCNSCSDCPQSSALGIQLNFFDAASSSTAGLVACSDPICTSAVQTTATECSSQNNQCGYAFKYGDGSGTSGFYISDTFRFDAILGDSLISNASALIVFGCSTYQSGDLTKTDKAVDGIFGFGQGDLSVISQLSSRGITPRVFSHCLKGEGNGGGILVLGEILEPGLVYSPLVPSQPHYNLNLQSIAVNGQLLPIDPAVFATENNRGTIVDSGTTLAYLVEEAYDPFVSAVTSTVSQLATPTISNGDHCYLVPTSISDIFPPVILNFAGGASMVLKPEEYLTHRGSYDGAAMWCMGFEKSQGGITILGDLVLKDKIIVYDLARQRVGWASYDCSLAVNVSMTSGKDQFVNAGQLSMSISSREMVFQLLPLRIMTLLVHTFVFTICEFL